MRFSQHFSTHVKHNFLPAWTTEQDCHLVITRLSLSVCLSVWRSWNAVSPQEDQQWKVHSFFVAFYRSSPVVPVLHFLHVCPVKCQSNVTSRMLVLMMLADATLWATNKSTKWQLLLMSLQKVVLRSRCVHPGWEVLVLKTGLAMCSEVPPVCVPTL